MAAMLPEIAGDRPYPPHGLVLGLWRLISPEYISWGRLTFTQTLVEVRLVLADDPREEGLDIYPHAVEHCGDLYLDAGHSRVVRALVLGSVGGMVRVYRGGLR